jgi:hypothetical protein
VLPIDDPHWSSLADAYGAASGIPDLLRALAADPRPKPGYEAEPWFSLWSGLCHQDDVYTASYAAVPHIVAIASAAPGPIDFSFFQLPAAIEIARHKGRGPAVPAELATAYHAAIAGLTDCVALHRHDDWDEPMLLSALTAQAVAKGNYDLAEVLSNLDEELITRIINLDFDFD